MPTTITNISVRDIRFLTSDGLHGSDAIHKDPDYSCPYVTLETDVPGLTGHGITFTLGRGNEVCVAMIEALKEHVLGQNVEAIFADMHHFWYGLANDGQLRWLGPEKGVQHFAVAALINALWDLRAKQAGKPLWQLLADMEPAELVDHVEFSYITDALTPDEARSILEANAATKTDRAEALREVGMPSYTSSAGWLGYTDSEVRDLVHKYQAEGWTRFKMKIGADLEAEVNRARLIREEIGPDGWLMVDANQTLTINEAIDWMQHFQQFNLVWFEEPSHVDDILGHVRIAKGIAPIGVAVGEAISNRVLFKQYMQAEAMAFCQIDSCRMGGVNEILAVILMAAKFGIPVCPHAGGVGLCEYVQHLAAFNYVAVSPDLDNFVIEYSDHLHEHFVDPVVMRNSRYQLPTQPGYSITMHPESLDRHDFPNGAAWT